MAETEEKASVKTEIGAPVPSATAPTTALSSDDKRKLLASLPKKKKSQRMKEKKIRDCYRLRKLVAPKHALLAINELKGVHISDFKYEQISNGGQQIFISEATINGVQYKGQGRSKNAAKTDICDQALRSILMSKITKAATAKMENREPNPDEEVPIATLVSYAIHKLFADWESEGFCLRCGNARNNANPAQPCTCPTAAGLATAIADFTATPKLEKMEEDDEEDGDDD